MFGLGRAFGAIGGMFGGAAGSVAGSAAGGIFTKQPVSDPSSMGFMGPILAKAAATAAAGKKRKKGVKTPLSPGNIAAAIGAIGNYKLT